MSHLFRELAPISSGAWDEIEAEAKRSLSHFLAARKLVDFTGPLGWEASSVPNGRTEAHEPGDGGVERAPRSGPSGPWAPTRMDFAHPIDGTFQSTPPWHASPKRRGCSS